MASRNFLCVAALTAACVCFPYVARAQGVKAAASKNDHGLDIAKNPYTGNAAAIAEGKDLFESSACSGCHGASAEGGACPSLVNATWIYGSDDTTLFNLIKRGSAALRAAGYARSVHEKSGGDMPPFAGMLSEEDEWKLIAWIRSRYAGDPALRNW